MTDATNDDAPGTLRSAVKDLARDPEAWRAFTEHPREVLSERGVEVPANVVLSFFRIPEAIDLSAAISNVICAVGWEPRLTYEWQCVCAEWMKIEKLGPPHVPEAPPDDDFFGLPPLHWPKTVRDFHEEYICVRREWKEIPAWTCVRTLAERCR